MPVPQRRSPAKQAAARHTSVWLAGDDDGFVDSPARQLQATASAFVDAPTPVADRYPGWIRLALPLVLSAGLWAGIIWLVRSLL